MHPQIGWSFLLRKSCHILGWVNPVWMDNIRVVACFDRVSTDETWRLESNLPCEPPVMSTMEPLGYLIEGIPFMNNIVTWRVPPTISKPWFINPELRWPQKELTLVWEPNRAYTCDSATKSLHELISSGTVVCMWPVGPIHLFIKQPCLSTTGLSRRRKRRRR